MRKIMQLTVCLLTVMTLQCVITPVSALFLPKETERHTTTDPLPAAEAQIERPTVVIDPGHGGVDGGSIGSGYTEKDITLQIALQLGTALEQRGCTVIYTRSTDTALSELVSEDLFQRVMISNDAQADAFISIHLNSSEYIASGFEVWSSFSDTRSYSLAQTLNDTLSALNYTEAREMRDQDESNLLVLALNEAPSVLLKLGFITSAEDMRVLADAAFQRELTDQLADTIYAYVTQ